MLKLKKVEVIREHQVCAICDLDIYGKMAKLIVKNGNGIYICPEHDLKDNKIIVKLETFLEDIVSVQK